jgi:hypothetical protein
MLRTLLAVAALALATPVAAQTTLWSIDKTMWFDAETAKNVDVIAGDEIDFDGNPATPDGLAFAYVGPHTGQYAAIVARGPYYCVGPWFSTASRTDFQWTRTAKFNGITKLVIQSSPSNTIRVVSIPVRACP